MPAGSLYSLLDQLHAEGISASPCPRLYVRPTQVGLGAWGVGPGGLRKGSRSKDAEREGRIGILFAPPNGSFVT